MTEPSPHWDKADWDKVTLGTTILPGVWKLEGEASRRIGVKTRKGHDGAITNDEGYQNAQLELIGRFTSSEDYEALQVVMKNIHPRRKGAARDPLSLAHPAATLLSIDKVYVVSVRMPELANGVMEIRIGLLEWTEQPKKLAKKKATFEYDNLDASEGGMTAEEVRRSFQNHVYGTKYGFERTDTGYETPSERIEHLDIAPNKSFAEIVREKELGIKGF